MTTHDIQSLLRLLRSDASNTTLALAAREAAGFIETIIRDHDARVTELLGHASFLEQQMREQKARADAAESGLLALAKVCGDVATIRLKEPTT